MLSSYCLIHSYFDEPSAEVSFWAGLPFLISSGILLYKLIMGKRNSAMGSLGAE